MAWKNVQYENGKYRTSEGGGGGSSTFADLDDVSFSNLQNGQVAKYNSTTQKWENANESGGGGTVTDVTVDGTSVVNQQGVAEIPAIPDGLHHYSTTEQVIGTWIDGKPLYEKSYSFTAVSSGTTIQVDSNIDTFMFVPEASFIKQTNSGNVVNLGFYEDSSNRCQAYYEKSTDSIQVRPLYSSLVGTGYITIRYTKTTD